MGRLSRREIEKRRSNDRKWGDPSGDPQVESSHIKSRSYAVAKQVRAHRDTSGSMSRDVRSTSTEKRWDK